MHSSSLRAGPGLGCVQRAARTWKEECSFPWEQVLTQTPSCAPEGIYSVVGVHAVLITSPRLPQPLHPVSSVGRDGLSLSSAWWGSIHRRKCKTCPHVRWHLSWSWELCLSNAETDITDRQRNQWRTASCRKEEPTLPAEINYYIFSFTTGFNFLFLIKKPSYGW